MSDPMTKDPRGDASKRSRFTVSRWLIVWAVLAPFIFLVGVTRNMFDDEKSFSDALGAGFGAVAIVTVVMIGYALYERSRNR